MNDKEKHKQSAIEHVDPAKENENILTSISLTKTRYYLNEHDYEENGIYDLE